MQWELDDGVILDSDGGVFVPAHDTLVVADLHIGFEDYLAQHGIFLPKIQKKHIFSRVGAMLDRYSPQTLIVNGDMKHEFSRNMPQEWDEVREFVDMVLEHASLKVVRGNHDNYLATILSEYGIMTEEHIRLGRFIISHGHKIVSGEGMHLIGHEHPAVVLRDEGGALVTFPSYIYVKGELLVMPALSLYSTGSDIVKGEYISPYLPKVDPETAEVLAIADDVIMALGTLQALRDII